MNYFKDLELFSIQVTQPAKTNEKDTSMVFSVWKSGVYTIRTTSLSSTDERPSGYAYKLSQEGMDKFNKIVEEYVHIFEDAPVENHVDGVKSMDYTFSFNEKYYTGNFAFFPDELINRDDFTSKDKKKMRWNNHVVEFYKKIQELSKDLESKNQLSYISNDAKELHYLKPSTRSYIASFRKGIGFNMSESKTKDSIVKRAVKEALVPDKIPSGKPYADLVSIMKESTVDMARNSKSVKEFDIAHGKLCSAISTLLGNDYDYVEVSRIVDYYFVLSLLVLDEIHTDEQALMLHYPVTKELLVNKFENASKVEYTFFQKDMRTPIPNSQVVPALSFLSAMRFDHLDDLLQDKKPVGEA